MSTNEQRHEIEERSPLKGEEGVTPLPPPVRYQEHGGALYAGGVPGNRGGTGRPPSAVRHAAREVFAERIPVLAEIADGVMDLQLRETCPSCGYTPQEPERLSLKTAAADRVKSLDLLARVALPQQREVIAPAVRERVVRTALILQQELDGPTYERIALQLQRVWGADDGE